MFGRIFAYGFHWSRGLMKSNNRFHDPLLPGDTVAQTNGCRHTNPDICGKNHMPDVCAFVRGDEICLAPPSSWAKQFFHLANKNGDEQK